MRGGFCDSSDLGRFILDLPAGKSIQNTTFWSARVAFPGSEGGPGDTTSPDLGDDSAPSEDASSFRRDLQTRQTGLNPNPSPSELLVYNGPIQYLVRKTGYYCVGMSVFRLLTKFLCLTTIFHQPSCPSRCYRLLRQKHRNDSPLISIRPIMVPFSFEMSSMDNSLRPIIQKLTYVAPAIFCRLASQSL